MIVATNPTYLCSKSCDIASEPHSISVSRTSIRELLLNQTPNSVRFDLIVLPIRVRKGGPDGIFGEHTSFQGPAPLLWVIICPIARLRRGIN